MYAQYIELTEVVAEESWKWELIVTSNKTVIASVFKEDWTISTDFQRNE